MAGMHGMDETRRLKFLRLWWCDKITTGPPWIGEGGINLMDWFGNTLSIGQIPDFMVPDEDHLYVASMLEDCRYVAAM